MRPTILAFGLLFLLVAFGGALTSVASAADEATSSDTDPRQGRHPNGPPKVAVEACAGLSEGAACSFTGRRGDEVAGTCFSIQGKSACKPDREPRGGQGQS